MNYGIIETQGVLNILQLVLYRDLWSGLNLEVRLRSKVDWAARYMAVSVTAVLKAAAILFAGRRREILSHVRGK